MHYTEVVSNAQVYGLEESIKRAKYPMAVDTEALNSEITNGIKKLAQCAKGTGHDQFLTGIIVQFDLTFTVKAWTEAERYSFLDFISSQSTMHRITKFNVDECYNGYVDPRVIDIMMEKVKEYNAMQAHLIELAKNNASENELRALRNLLTEKYLEILYTNPAGFTLTARMTTNYRCLKNIWRQRRDHRLPEWREFCKWIETLPYAKELICYEEKGE